MHTPGAKLSATGLKWIAYACMLLDHFAYAFLYYRSPACIALRTRRQNGAAYFLLSFGGGLLPHQKRAPLFDAAADVCTDFAAVLQQLLRLSVYARMEIYGIFGRRQCVVYAVSCAAFACGMGAHQAVVRTVRRLRRPFRLRRSSSFGLGLVCVGHCLGLLLHARPPGFAAVRYLR